MNVCTGENIVIDKKKPSQVDVHKTHFINSEINLNIGLVKLNPSSLPALWIVFLKLLKIDP